MLSDFLQEYFLYLSLIVAVFGVAFLAIGIGLVMRAGAVLNYFLHEYFLKFSIIVAVFGGFF